jgi:hypothetical protein
MSEYYRAAMSWEATVVPARLDCVVIADAAALLSQFWARDCLAWLQSRKFAFGR